MKKLTVKAAWECENAMEPRCRCRCGGKLHGARRKLAAGTLNAPAVLPNDPHAPAFYCPCCGQALDFPARERLIAAKARKPLRA